ncbi:MAG: hypothetical protein JSV52_09885 [Candidatus Zixiibacteriota bacterium]|nr:MAG: hypothetical protein JSV52_09885 [candidate division Zixibacteria bacterium]
MARLVFGLLVLILSAGGALADGIEVSQSLENSSIAYADSVKFEIVLTWDGPQTAYLFDKPLNPRFESLKVRRFASSIGSSLTGGTEVTTKKFLYVLEPTMAGIGRIEPVTISYLSWPDSLPGQLLTEAMSVAIAPPQAVVTPEQSYRWLWWLIIFGMAFVVAAVVTVVVRRNRRPVEVVKTPREDLLEELAGARTAAGSDLKKFQTDVYKILTVFLRRQYNLEPFGPVDDRFEQRMKDAGVEHAAAKKINEWLSRAERDKYSPAEFGPGETVRLESELREFFEKFRE